MWRRGKTSSVRSGAKAPLDSSISSHDDGAAGDIDHALWPPRLAKIRMPGSAKASGWAFGDRGVLTAWPAIAALLPENVPDGDDAPAQEPRANGHAEIVVGASPGRSFEATVAWHSETAGLAILSISDRTLVTWQTLLRSTPDLPLAFPRAESGIAVTVVGLPGRDGGSESSTVAWMLATPEKCDAQLTRGERRTDRGFVDVDRRALPRAARRHGLPGGIALTFEPEPMVLGVLYGRPRGRRTLRFDVATLPDPVDDPALAAALAEVGAPPAVISMDGPILQRHLDAACLDASLLPRRVADISDAGFFGVRLARSDITEPNEPYFGWVSRPERLRLADAIDAALAGTGPRFIILRGPSAAGKSRVLAEAIRSHSALRDFAVLTPAVQRSVLDMPGRLIPRKSVIVIDELGNHPATSLTRERVRRLLANHPETLVIATLLDLPEASGTARLVDNGAVRRAEDDGGAGSPLGAASLSGVLSVAHDDVLTRTITVRPNASWARAGGSTNRSDWALARARKQGVGLGEYLAGYHELADHYTAALWPTRALVELVGDWARSGVGEPLPLATARQLWDELVPTRLPRDELRAFERLAPADREKRWRGALAYACEEVLGCGRLVIPANEGLIASEFTRVHVDAGVISAQLWDYLLRSHQSTPRQRVALGIAALGSGTPQRALRAFEAALFLPDEDPLEDGDAAWHRRMREVLARRGVGIYHSRMGRDEQAVMVFTDLVDTFGGSDDTDICEQVAQALLGIGLTFTRLGSDGQAVSAYTELVNRYGDHPSPTMTIYVAKALLGQAVTLGSLGRGDEARTAYADLAARFDTDPSAAVQELVAIARGKLGEPGESHELGALGEPDNGQ